MDERLLPIVKAMARGELASEQYSTTPYSCLYCEEQTWFYHDEMKHVTLAHKADCAVTLARQILKENGTPVHIYKISYQHPALGWTSWYVTGTREEEIVSRFPDRQVEDIGELEIVVADED